MSIAELYRNASPVGTPSRVSPTTDKHTKEIKPLNEALDFGKVLEREHVEQSDAARGFKISQHAATRIRSREIPWDTDLEARVRSGIDSALAKGSRETLILAGGVAVIANVESRTVITAMNSSGLESRVFTNIDSAVLV